jgi:sporulation protein YlmC with PRC-barrel domain
MRKARLLQSVAILAGSLALTLAPADSHGQSATGSSSQGYPTYGYGMPGAGSYDQQPFRTRSEQRPYGAADQYGIDRSVEPYGNQNWPQQAYDQPQGPNASRSGAYGQGQPFGGPAYGPYAPEGSQTFGPGEQAFGRQDWRQRYPQQAQAGVYGSDMGRQADPQSRFGYERPGGAEDFYGRGEQDRWLQEEMRRRQQAYGEEYGGSDQQRYSQQAQRGAYSSDMGRQGDPQSRFGYEQPGGGEDFYGRSDQDRWLQEEMQRRQHAYGQPFGMGGAGGYPGQGYGTGGYPGQGYGTGGQAYAGQGYGYGMGGQAYGAPRSMGDRQMGMGGGYPAYPYGQGWQDQQRYGMQGQFPQDRRYAERGGQLDRFGQGGGYPQFGPYEPGQQYGQFHDRRMMMGQGGMTGMQGGRAIDQQAYGAARSGSDAQQQAGPAGRIEVVSAGELVGRSVTDAEGREIGTSRYLVIGAQSGKVHFVMVGSGAEDGLDLGTDLLPVPWRVVDAGQDQRLAVSIPADRLRELPRVAPSELASVVGPQMVGQIRQWITASPDQSTGQGASGSSAATTAQSGQTSGTDQQAASGTAQSGTQTQSQSTTTAQSGQGTTATTGTSGTGATTGTSGTAGETQAAQSGQGTTGSGTGQAQEGGQPSAQAGSQIASADNGAGLGAAEEDVVVLGARYGALVAPPTLMTEGELAGTTVFTADGMPIGDIDEILIDSRRGQVAYVLVSTGGFLGTDQRWLPVPFTAMTWMPTHMGFALRIQSAQLATLPELTQGTAPRFIRRQDLANLYYAYGAEPYWMRPGGGTTEAVDDRG